MKYFIIAGEASGDLHASNLMTGLKKEDALAGFRFIGGDLMASIAGAQPLQHYRDMNFMGLFAVLMHLGTIRGVLKKTKKSLLSDKPDALILVDYAGFNLRIAKFASKQGIRVFYYISPKVWAWRKSRIKILKKYVDQLFVIFPFEREFFKENGLHVEFHGNPLMDQLEEFQSVKLDPENFRKSNGLADKPIIALLAGSRRQEISECLPEMVSASSAFKDYLFVVAGAPSVDKSLYESYLSDTPIRVVYDQTYDLLNNSFAAVVTSGTATLETALFNVPEVVVYKAGALTYRLGKLFVKFRFFSLVNLIYGDELVKEILQFDLSKRIRNELDMVLHEKEYRQKILDGFAQIRESLGASGASLRVAKRIVEIIS